METDGPNRFDPGGHTGGNVGRQSTENEGYAPNDEVIDGIQLNRGRRHVVRFRGERNNPKLLLDEPETQCEYRPEEGSHRPNEEAQRQKDAFQHLLRGAKALEYPNLAGFFQDHHEKSAHDVEGRDDDDDPDDEGNDALLKVHPRKERGVGLNLINCAGRSRKSNVPLNLCGDRIHRRDVSNGDVESADGSLLHADQRAGSRQSRECKIVVDVRKGGLVNPGNLELTNTGSLQAEPLAFLLRIPERERRNVVSHVQPQSLRQRHSDDQWRVLPVGVLQPKFPANDVLREISRRVIRSEELYPVNGVLRLAKQYNVFDHGHDSLHPDRGIKRGLKRPSLVQWGVLQVVPNLNMGPEAHNLLRNLLAKSPNDGQGQKQGRYAERHPPHCNVRNESKKTSALGAPFGPPKIPKCHEVFESTGHDPRDCCEQR